MTLQTELDSARLALKDSGQCRTVHAAQLMAELQRQQREQEEKDRMSQVNDPWKLNYLYTGQCYLLKCYRLGIMASFLKIKGQCKFVYKVYNKSE